MDSSASVTIYRRDLFDARFQELLAGGDDQDASELEIKTEQTSRPSSIKGCENEQGSETRISRGKGTETAVSRDAPDVAAASLASTTSDLIPGIYEGGLKTWECSLDLVASLHELVKKDEDWVTGKAIVEVSEPTRSGRPILFMSLDLTLSVCFLILVPLHFQSLVVVRHCLLFILYRHSFLQAQAELAILPLPLPSYIFATSMYRC